MEDVLEIVALNWFLWIEKFKEFLDKLWCNIDLERAHFNTLVDHQLQEELVDALEMRPGGVHILLCLDTGLREPEAAFFHIGQRPENVLLDHLDDFVQIRDDQADNVFLVLEKLLQFIDCLKTIGLHSNY